MLYFERGSVGDTLSSDDLRAGLFQALERLGPRRRVLVVPPDFTRFHSQAGVLTKFAHEFFGPALTDVLPALGTHTPVTPEQIAEMFAGVPPELFRVHNWRTGITTLAKCRRNSCGRRRRRGGFRVAGATGQSHLDRQTRFDPVRRPGRSARGRRDGRLQQKPFHRRRRRGRHQPEPFHRRGLRHGENDGRADTPVRRILNYASEHFTKHLPIVYVHTVIGRADDGRLVVRGLFVSDDVSGFDKASAFR